jgi:hypothetical protein
MSPKVDRNTQVLEGILNHSRHTCQAFDKLCRAGCNAERLKVELSFVWSGARPEKYHRNFDIRKFRALPSRLRLLADEMANAIPLDRLEKVAADKLLDEYTVFLQPLFSMASMLETIKLLPGRKRGPKYASILTLLRQVKRETGKPHYAEVSELVNAAFFQAGNQRSFSPENLKMLTYRDRLKTAP